MAKTSRSESQKPAENSDVEVLKQMLRDTEIFGQLRDIFNNLTTPQGRKEQGYSSQVDFIETLKKETVGWREGDGKEAAKLFIEEFGPQAKEVKKPKRTTKVEVAVEELVDSGALDPRAEAPTVEVVTKATDDAIEQSQETGQPITLEKYRRLIMDWFPRLAVRQGFEDRESGKKYSNLDGNACLFLFREIFGFAKGTPEEQKYVEEEVEFVKPGSYKRGALNLDTSPGLHDIQFQDATFFVDHHGTESERQTSAFNILFEDFKRVGLDEQISPENRVALERLAQFVTYIDSYSLPQDKHWDSAWRDSHRTLYGVSLAYQNNIPVEDLFEFFKHHDLNQAWSLDINQTNKPYLRKIKQLAAEWLKEKQKTDQFVEKIGSIPDAGFAIETAGLGKILVQTQRTSQEKKRSLQFAALAHGYDGILVWEPNSKTFFLATGSDKEITPEIAGVIGEGILIRKSMIKHSGSERKNTLESLLIALGANPESIPSSLRQKNNQENPTMETTSPNPNTTSEKNDQETVQPVPNQETSQIVVEQSPFDWDIQMFDTPESFGHSGPSSQEDGGREYDLTQSEESLENPVSTPGSHQDRSKTRLEAARENFELKKLEWEKYQGIAGMFRGRKLSKEDKSVIYEEYQAALQEYAREKAEYLADKSITYLENNTRLASGFEKVIAENLGRKFGGEARLWLEKIYAGYQKLGEWNIAKLFKFEEKLAGWQPETKTGKVGKVLANIGGRYLSVRTAVSFGLLGGAVAAGGGIGIAGGLMIGKRLFSGLGGFVGTNELWKGIEQVKMFKEIPQDKLIKVSSWDLIDRIRQIEVYCLLNGKEDFSVPGYKQLQEEYNRRVAIDREIETERVNQMFRESLIEGSEITEDERQAAEKAAKIEGTLSELESSLLTEEHISDLLSNYFSSKKAFRYIVSGVVALLLGSGAIGAIIHELSGGKVDLAETVDKEAIDRAITKVATVAASEQPVEVNEGVAPLQGEAQVVQEAAPKVDQAAKVAEQTIVATQEKIIETNIQSDHLIELATLRKGEGLIRVLQRQLEAAPEQFGFDGDTADTDAVHHWAQKTASSLSIKEGYWDPKTGDQVWVKWSDKEPIRFQVAMDSNGELNIEEQGTEGRTFVHHRAEAVINKPDVAPEPTERIDPKTGLKITPKVGRLIDEESLQEGAVAHADNIQGGDSFESQTARNARFGDRVFNEPVRVEPETEQPIKPSPRVIEEVAAAQPAVEEPAPGSEVASAVIDDQPVNSADTAASEQVTAAEPVENPVSGPEDFPESVRPYAHYLEAKLQAAQEFAEATKNSSASSPITRGYLEQILLENDKFVADVGSNHLDDYSGRTFPGYDVASARAELEYQFNQEIQPNTTFKINIEPSAVYLLNNPDKLPELAVQADNFDFQFTRNPSGGMGVLINHANDYEAFVARHNIATDSWVNAEIRSNIENPENVTQGLVKVDYLLRALQTLENAGSGNTQAARVVREVLTDTAKETARQSGQDLDKLLTSEIFNKLP